MSKYRNALPQQSGEMFMTDGGMETTLVFHDGMDLPYFAAFDLLKSEDGLRKIRDYYRRYASLALERGLSFIMESVTWRASADWGNLLGYDAGGLSAANRKAIEILHDIRAEFETADVRFIVSGCIGPRGDGYNPGEIMDPETAEAYHRTQIQTLKESGADLITVFTLTYAEEAIGLTRAALAADIPIVISFTLETDGRLPTGQSLKDAILAVDAATGEGPAYYMINCAHPTHFAGILNDDAVWKKRIRGIRANASKMSHAELDQAEELDDGNPLELGEEYRSLLALMPHVNVLGGCCGTDHRHVVAICDACAA